jgi:hypothetical protein
MLSQYLTRIDEGLCRVQVTSKNNYLVKSMSQFMFLVVASKVELNRKAIPGDWSQIIRIRVVKFEVYGGVCCSCDFPKGYILCADISWPVSTSLMNLWWMCAGEELLVFISGSQYMLE